MQAIVLTDYGDPEVLRVTRVDDPVPGSADVLVAIEASAVNRADVLQRRGAYPSPVPRPPAEIPGLEFSGSVVAVGSAVTRVVVGDAVLGLLSGGGYAERVATPERMVLPVPPGFTFAEAAALPEAFFTAYDALQQVRLAMGDTVLIHAAASGVGTSAVQLAHHLGARVLATCSAGKMARVEALGADAVADYRAGSTPDFVRRETAGRGVDAILDFVGADTLEQNIEALAVGGRLIVIGTLSGGIAPINLSHLMAKRASVTGTLLRSRPPEEKMALTQAIGRHVWPFWADGRIRPVMDRVFPLAEAADAHRRMEANQNVGKIGLGIGPAALRPPVAGR
ncbi:MAG: NAD(P)H-quinone oxidoreductase [Thermaerobacter sp.]|nr:NAD(P)H-quinone oxidoreductase [Thermaerobacter sp.]